MENESLSLYDNRLQNKEINILKTILPYLGSTAQKNISMMISYLQMQKTMEYLKIRKIPCRSVPWKKRIQHLTS